MTHDELMALPWNRDTTRLPTISPPENWQIGELPWNVGKHSMLWTPNARPGDHARSRRWLRLGDGARRPRGRPGAGRAAAVSGHAKSGPAVYLGDVPRSVLDRNGVLDHVEPPLYPDRAGQPCRVVARSGSVPYPLVLEWSDGTRGIARERSIEVRR